ncbi:hypothetical protein [Vagococcus fluvialis]|uniref:hypothetical protein n=1 Tax=Vagococcus fluvialis TaxID=2738 RepID=UPI001D0BA712|nr:hypothetical protein [Vagococcus fluvialis]UDM78469.1 hypothetical protein K5K98_14615 [Vagococcus fluvialis]UDM84022.1 hypothetical protein K5K96_14435 [Vagococcus fluvialis]
MGIEVNKVHMPVEFEMGEIAQDSRFQKVKIWVAHTGENLNNTYFTKELLTEMTSTLPYIPIVGFVEQYENGGDDFSDHRSTLVIESNKIKLEYQGKAYGFVSDEPNAKFEFKGGKEWLTCEGYLWTKFTKSIDIFNKSDGVKSQSMEIEDVDGEVDDWGRMVFSQGRFSALCILGEHINPAMAGSTIEYFSMAKDSIKEMIYEFSLQKGELDLPTEDIKKKKVEDEVEDDNKAKAKEEAEAKAKADKEKADKEAADKEAKAQADKEAQEKADKEAADKEAKAQADKEAQEKAEQEAADKETQVTDPEPDTSTETPADESGAVEEFAHIAQFELSHNQLRQNLSSLIRSAHDGEDKSVYVLEVFDDRMIAEVYDWKSDSQVYLEVGYSRENETVVLGSTKEVVSMFVTKEEQSKLESDRKRVVELEAELQELQEFKVASETGAKEAVLEEFQEGLTDEESANIREQFSELSVEGVEKEVAYTLIKKTKGTEEFSGTRSVSLGATGISGKYGALDMYFKK